MKLFKILSFGCLMTFGLTGCHLFKISNFSGNENQSQSDVDAKLKETPELLRWDYMRDLDYESGKIASDGKLDGLIGKNIKIPGFVVPIDMVNEEASEFILVPTAGACYHVPPPPPNQMIMVKMKGGKAPLRKDGPVWVTGVVQVQENGTQWGKVSFQVYASQTEPYTGGY